MACVNALRGRRADRSRSSAPARRWSMPPATWCARRDAHGRAGGRARPAVSRTTAYRYFPNQRALLVAAHPETAASSLLPGRRARRRRAPGSTSSSSAFTRLIVDTEPQQRTMLRLSLERRAVSRAALPLRQGRAIGWIEEALEPLRGELSDGRGAPARPGHPQRHRHRGPGLADRRRRPVARRTRAT